MHHSFYILKPLIARIFRKKGVFIYIYTGIVARVKIREIMLCVCICVYMLLQPLNYL
jgi:hypothetical protein